MHRREGVFMNRHIEKVYGKSAVQILKEHNISLEPPIDLDQLLKSLGIYVREHDFSKIEKTSNLEKDSILGATLLIDDDLIILYKQYEKKRNDHGKRFTIAHEIGHCALHSKDLEENRLELRNDFYNKNDEREMAACKFAGQLLIPEESLKKICKRLIIPSLKILAEIFNVSVGVMRERLNETDIVYIDDVR